MRTISEWWSNPPYGGMVYGNKPNYTFQEKAWEEGRTFDFAKDEPKYGELTDFSEPITQRRLMVMMDDYIILADHAEGEREHTFDWLFQMKGFYGLNNPKKAHLRHDKQLSTNPLGAAQFFTNCDWSSVESTSRSHYEMKWGEGKQAQFLSVIEPYESASVIRDVKAECAERLIVTLSDGRRQEITITNLANDPNNITVEVKELDKSGKLLREEIAK